MNSRAKLLKSDDKPHNSSRGRGLIIENPYKPGFVDDKDLETVKMAVDKELDDISNAFHQTTERTADTITRIDKLEIDGTNQYGELKASIEQVDKVSKEGDTALAESIKTFKAEADSEFGKVNASIVETNRVMADADKVLADKIDAISGSFEGDLGGLFAVIEEVRKISIDGDEALGQRIDKVQVDFQAGDATLSAGIKTEETARVTADQALATRITEVSAEWKNADLVIDGKFQGIIDQERVDRELAEAVLAGKITQEEADRIKEDEDLLRQLIAEMKEREDGDKENADKIVEVSASVRTETEARANADEALGKRIDTVSAEYKLSDSQLDGKINSTETTLKAAVQSEALARADADSALGKRVDTVSAEYKTADKVIDDKVDSNKNNQDKENAVLRASISSVSEAFASADGALGRRIDAVTAEYKSADASLEDKVTKAYEGKIDQERVDRELAQAVLDGKITQEEADRLKEDEDLLRQLIAEKLAREEGDKTNAGLITEANAAVKSEAEARANADGALGKRIDSVTADYKSADTSLENKVTTAYKGEIDKERVARELAVALAEGKIDKETADRIMEDEEFLRQLIAEQQARLNGDKVNADKIIEANAAIKSESEARADAVAAVAQKVDTVSAEYKSADASLETKITKAYEGKIDQERVERELAQAVQDGKISQEAADRLKEDEELLRQLIAEMQAREKGDKTNADEAIAIRASLTTETSARAEADKALASQIQTVQAEIAGEIASVKQYTDVSVQSAKDLITVEEADRLAQQAVLEGKISKEEADRLVSEALLAGDIKANKDAVNLEVAQRLAEQAVLDGKITKEEADRLIAQGILQGNIDATNGAVNAISAKWGVQVDANGAIGGIELNSGASGISEFKVRADRISFTDGHATVRPITIVGNQAAFNSVLIREDCTILGTLYADRVIGLPTGKYFSAGGDLLPTQDRWVDLIHLPIPPAHGRFNMLVLLAGALEITQYGQGSNTTLRMLINGQVVVEAVPVNFVKRIIGQPFNGGPNGGTITIQQRTSHNNQGGYRYTWPNGYVYAAIQNDAFWQ